MKEGEALMLNIDTVNKLNRLGFGLDIDKIETYLLNYMKANYISDISKYKAEACILHELLKDIKPGSVIYTDNIEYKKIKEDKYDKLLTLYPNDKVVRAYGSKDSKLEVIKKRIYTGVDSIDIVALPEIEGIDISCIYKKGNLYKIYAIGEKEKYIDLTDELDYLIDAYIEDIDMYELVDIRAKLSIRDGIRKKFNTLIDTVYYINNSVFIEYIDLVATNIIFDVQDDKFKTNWEKFDYLKEIGFIVPETALIRNVNEINFCEALLELDKYFKYECKELYAYNGIRVLSNNVIDKSGVVIFDSYNVNSGIIYKSIVKSVYTDSSNSYKLNIVPIKCNNNFIVDKVCVDDLYLLEEQKIKIGDTVRFRVINGDAVMI